MNRRNILKSALAFAGASALGFRAPLARATEYAGKLFVFVQASGGWDPTSFCDPKANVAGERPINHWADEDEIREAGGIAYAPFGANQAFFEKYHRDMLVINGVDAQTNSHDTGRTYNWSGRNSDGYPSLAAILAGHHAPGLVMPYVTFGGFSRTHGIAKVMRLSNPRTLHGVFGDPFDQRCVDGDPRLLVDYVVERSRMLPDPQSVMPSEMRSRLDFEAAFNNDDLRAFGDALPDDFEGNGLRAQAQVAVAAFEAGMALSADLHLSGFDTHGDHDEDHADLLAELTDGVDYLWEHAETRGLADRLVVVMGSDFGRTNHYNEDDGKDHWPIGSYVVMEKNQPWTGRAVGETDELHFAHRINPRTLRRDDANGAIIHPRHVHKALRRYLGVENAIGTQRYPFNHTEDFAFFG